MAHFRGLLLLLFFVTLGRTLAFPGGYFGTEVRHKRDVLKGKNHNNVLVREKRYIGRVPVAYMKKALNLQPYGDVEDDHVPLGNMKPISSHFREYPVPNSASQGRYSHGHNNIDTKSLTDEEISTLLLMLDGYKLDDNNHRPKNWFEPVDKRETGKKRRSIPAHSEQPMSFDNSPQLILGNRKRSGDNLMMKSSRVKKETDPSALANLFAHDDDDNNVKPFPSGGGLMKEKTKKSIDWSNYLGIDKRAGGQPIYADSAVATSSNTKPAMQIPTAKLVLKGSKGTTTTDKKDFKDDDRTWVLDEFYKNFAMMTNVKRKRDTRSGSSPNELERLNDLEQKMTQVGDKIIWDALKYTGAHRDQDMSPREKDKVKASLAAKLATAYGLEKVHNVVSQLRQKLEADQQQQVPTI